MIHLYTQKSAENQGVSVSIPKTDRETKIIKSSEMAVQVTSGNNLMSLYSNQNEISDEKNPSNLNLDLKNNLDYLTVMANTVSSSDFNEIFEEGKSPADMDEAESVNTLDRIKAKMAESGMVIEGYNDDLPIEVIEETTGSRVAAEALKREFSERDLSINKDNLEEISDILKKASEIEEITDGMCDYILRNAIEPTIENLYRVRFSAAEVPFKEGGYFADEYGHIVKDGESDMTKSDYFTGKINEIAEQIGIEDETEKEALLEEGSWLVKSRILCNASNLSLLHDLRSLKLPLSVEETAGAIANAVERGDGVSKAEFTKTDNLLKRALNAKEVIDEATEEDVASIVNEGKILNIENLAAAKDAAGITEAAENDSPDIIKGRRILEETRLRMSVEANYMMLKRGISIETVALEETVNVLKALEDKVTRDFFGNESVEAAEKSVLFKESRQVIAEMPYLPVKAVGDAIKSANVFTLKLTYEIGVGLKNQFDKAQQTYETVGTQVRGDLGDSIKKAFANVDDILKDQGMEINENNRKAVRILGYSEMEITQANIENVREKETMLNRVINKMNPVNTLELIREGVNPLEISLEELEEKLDSYGRDAFKITDNYASFICKLERTGDISEEERESYIGIYRLLDKIEKSDGAAIGSLIKAEAGINFKNLLTAIRTGKSSGLDVKLDESVGEIIEAAGYEFDISAQIASAFTNVLQSEEGTNEYLKREFEEYKASLTRDEKNIEEELNFLGEKVTPNNLKAMGEILANDKDYNPWKKMDDFAEKLEDEKLKDAMKSLSESFEGEESVKEAYENVFEETKEALSRISESGVSEYFDIKAIKQTFRQIGLISKMTREENYEVPIEAGEETVNLRVKIMRKAEKEGKVFASFETEGFGNVLAQFTVNEGVLSALIAGDSETGLERLKNEGSIEDSFKNAGFEEVTFNYIQTDIINVDYFRQHFDRGNSDEVTTKQLYNIAKTFIQTVKKAGN